MSKHFELMKELEKEHPFLSDSATGSPVPSSVSGGNNGKGHQADEEALRLVQQVFLLQTNEAPRVVVFSGIDHGSGCSQVCASVARVLAKSASRPVCLVEANFRSPSLSGVFGTSNGPGLTDALLCTDPIISFTKAVADGLFLISAGTLAPDSANLLTSQQLRARLSELRQEFEFVIIDSAPMTHYSDAIVLGQLSDGVVMILEANSTRRKAAKVATNNLRSVNVPILAAVLNKRTFPIPEEIYQRL